MQSQLGQISKKFEEPYTQQFSSGGFFFNWHFLVPEDCKLVLQRDEDVPFNISAK